MSDLDKQLEAAATLMRSDADQCIALLVEITSKCPKAIAAALGCWEGMQQHAVSRLSPPKDDGERLQLSLIGILSRFVCIGASAVADSVQAQANGDSDGH